MKLRPHVVVRLGHACIDRGHPAFFRRLGSAWAPKAAVATLKARFERLTYERYPLSAAEEALPEEQREGEVPKEVVEQCKMEPAAPTRKGQAHADKLQTPAFPMTATVDAFTNVRPNHFSGAATAAGTRSHTESATDAFATFAKDFASELRFLAFPYVCNMLQYPSV